MTGTWMNALVRRKWKEADDIVALELEPDTGTGAPFPAFTAGAHIDVEMPNSGIVRQYSLYGNPADPARYRIAVLLEAQSRGGSAAMHNAVAEGSILRISQPRNHFALKEQSSHIILIAGGIGITPILCMATELSRAGRSFEFHYCVRTKSRAAFLRDIMQSSWQDRASFHFDDGPKEQTFNAHRLLSAPTPGVHVYVCGPEGLINHVLGVSAEQGWPADQVHREFFSNSRLDAAAGTGFTVHLARSGKRFEVGEEETIADVLIRNGIKVEMSCEQGVCGTCLTRVIDGIPDHRDMYMTPEEQQSNEMMTICCSRSITGTITIDL